MDWTQKSNDEIIDQIETEYHGFLDETLPMLSMLSNKVMELHSADHPELKDVHRLFEQVKGDLEQRVTAEEDHIFPAIRKLAEDQPSQQTVQLKRQIDKLTEDHQAFDAIFKKLRTLTHDYTVPEDACPAYQMVFEKLEELESTLQQQAQLEEEVLFPRIRA